jgi:uncharacterized membrane protein
MEGHVRVQRWFESRKDRRFIKNYILQYEVIVNMHAVRLLIAFLFLISLGLGFTNVSGNQPSYNPGDTVSLTISNDNITANQTWVNVTFILDNYNFSCNRVRYGLSFPLDVGASCVIPSNLVNGTWNITAYNEYSSIDNSTNTTFVLNSTNANFNISTATFLPGGVLTYYINTTYLTGSWFNINTSNLSITGSGISILNCTNITNSSAGRYTRTCGVNSTAAPGSYALNLAYPNFNTNTNVSAAFAVNISWNSPTVTLNVSSFRMEKGNVSYVRVNITSNSNINETLYINVTGCDAVNLTCSLNTSTNLTAITAFSNTSVVLNVTSTTGATAGSYTLYINVSNSTNGTTNVRPSLTAIINPFHNFSLWTNVQPGQVPAGQMINYTFRITNTGDSVSNFSLSCNTSVNFTCAFNMTNNTISVDPTASINVSLTVTALSCSPLGEESLTAVNVTDYFGLTWTLPGVSFNTTTTGNLGGVVVTNVSQYVHNIGEKYSFNISINNTGNIDGNDTLFNVTITALNSSGWSLYLTNYSNFSNSILMNDTYMANFTLNITSLSYQYIFVNITAPSGATSQNFTRLSVYVTSAKNSSRFDNKNITIKLPIYTFSIGMVYNRTGENLSLAIYNVSVENGMLINGTWVNYSLNYTILASNGSVKATNLNATAGTTYNLSTTGWLTGLYNLAVSLNTTTNYNSSFLGSFYLSRWTALPVPSASQIANVILGGNTTVTISNTFDNSTDVVNLTNIAPPLTVQFRGHNGTETVGIGGYCNWIQNTTYQYICTAGTLSDGNTTYNLSVSTTIVTCSRDFSCTFSPSLTNSTSIGIGEITNVAGTPPSNQSGSQNPPPASNTTNRTTTTTTGLKFTMPSNVTLLNTSQTIYIPINNTNTSRQNVSVNISEASDYIHFSLTYVAPKNISGNSTLTVNITLTPFKWAKPGTYTITVNINSVNSTFTVTVPQPNDTKKIHRYVEVSKNRATSMVTLGVKNRNGYSAFMNVTENISKQIAASAKNLTITSAINYTVIEQDPVIMWMMNMSQNQERSIIYLVAGDLGNSNLFKEPNITEGRMSTGGGGTTTTTGGGDTTWLIIGIIVVVVIAAAVVYLFFLKPRGIKLPIKYGAFVKQEKKGVGVLGALKGVPGKITSLFKREKKEPIAGEKKSLLSRLSLKKKPAVKEEPKKEEKKAEPGKPKPTKEDLLKKLNEVYKK